MKCKAVENLGVNETKESTRDGQRHGNNANTEGKGESQEAHLVVPRAIETWAVVPSITET